VDDAVFLELGCALEGAAVFNGSGIRGLTKAEERGFKEGVLGLV